jgi:hypothetical protein
LASRAGKGNHCWRGGLAKSGFETARTVSRIVRPVLESVEITNPRSSIMTKQPLTPRMGGWLVALFTLAVLPLEFPRPVAAQPPKEDFPVGGLIGEKYKKLNGAKGPLGRPTSKEMDSKEGRKGRYQTFEHGAIGWSPATGPKSLQVLYLKGNELVFEWGDTSPHKHEFFLVRCDLNGNNVLQEEVKGRTGGRWSTRVGGGGRYRLVVEGGEKPLVGKAKFPQGWSNPLYVNYTPPSPDYKRYRPRVKEPAPAGPQLGTVSVKHIPPATSVADAKAHFDRRTAAAVLYNASLPLPNTTFKNEMNFGAIALAKLAYPDYFQSDRVPGSKKPARDEVIEMLRRLKVGSKSGTSNDSFPKRTGEYDVALTMLVSILYKYYDVLPPDVQNHILDGLLNKRGPFDPDDLRPFKPLAVPETENHVMMIESARYLTNQLLYKRTGDPKYDNARNGMDEWMLKHLQQFLKTDFIEYNARPYQNYTLSALLNLYSYTSDRQPSSARVKTAAHMVLDYVMAKTAVSSSDSRRSVPYRRKLSYNTPHFLNDHYDPQNAFSMLLAGTTDMVSGDMVDAKGKIVNKKGDLPGNFAWQMQWAGLSDYRLPDVILDLMVNRSHRVFFQRFHHHAEEAYAGSPSYLISAGGHYATFAYKFVETGKQDDIGLALPTTFMPTGQGTTRNNLIRFEGAKENDKRSNMGVAPDFACGLNPVIPELYRAAAVAVDDNGRRTPGNLTIGPWTFLDQSDPSRQINRYAAGLPKRGYYLAVYRRDGFGFLEAYDVALRSRLKFDDFIAGVLKRNGATAFKLKGRNTYAMTDGRKIQFEVSPDSRVFHNAEKPFFVSGTLLNSALGSGEVTIDNPSLRKRIVLDFRDWKSPKRTETTMPR